MKSVPDAIKRLEGVICAAQECLREPLLNDLRWVLDTLNEIEAMQEAPALPEDPAPVVKTAKVLKPTPGSVFLLSDSLLEDVLDNNDTSWFDRVHKLHLDSFEVYASNSASATLLMLPGTGSGRSCDIVEGLFDGRGHLAYFHGSSLLWVCRGIALISYEKICCRGEHIFVDRPNWSFVALIDHRLTSLAADIDHPVCSNMPLLLCRCCAATATASTPWGAEDEQAIDDYLLRDLREDK